MTIEAPHHLTELPRADNLRASVLNALRAAVISGELVPGTVYSAPALGASFGVSATPVREAMQLLARQGMVEVVPNKGFRVREVSDADLDEITHVRLLIEPRATRQAMARIGPEQMPRLRSMAQQIVDSAAARDMTGYLESDRQLHLALLEHLGNRRLVETVGELRSQTRLYGLRRLMEGAMLQESAQEHHRILDLVERKDGEALEELLERHIGHTRGLWATAEPEA